MTQLKTLLNEEKRKLTYTKSGDTYVGEVTGTGKQAKKNGYGVYTFKSDGSQLKGHWKNEIFSGWGSYITPKGVEWKGNWVDGKLNGKKPIELDQMKPPNATTTPRDKNRYKFEDDKVWIYAKNKDNEWLAAKRGTDKWYNLEASNDPKLLAAAAQLEIRATRITN